jgi:predicted nucleotidyltransferase
MKTIQSATLRKDLFKILDQIGQHGEPVEILKHDRPVAVLGPSAQVPAAKRKPLIDLDAIAKFCKQYQIARFFLFGSILREDFDGDSDVDVMVDTKGRRLKFREECSMLDLLETMFGRKVDLVTKDAVESPSMNPYLRASILPSLRLVYDEAS